MRALRQDIRFAFRMLRRNPLFTVVTVVTLALGIGANTAIFSVVRGVLLKPLPYFDPSALAVVRVGWDEVGSGRTGGAGHQISEPELYDFRRGNRTVQGIGAYYTTAVNVTGSEGDAERIPAGVLTADAFSLLGVDAGIGRPFTVDEDQPTAARVAVLGYNFWRRRYGGDPDILGSDVTINGLPRTVVGIMRPDFKLPEDLSGGARTQLWLPIRFDEENLSGRGGHYLNTVARLEPGVTLEQASSDLNAIARALTEQGHYHAEANFRALLSPLTDEVVGEVRPALLVLFGAVGLVLLIACANVANLMLARAEGRKRELAVRTALGAGRGVLIRQLMTESVVLGVGGGVAGVALAHFGLTALIAVDPTSVPRLAEVGLDGAVLGYAISVSVFTGLLFGIAPALRSGSVDLQNELKEGGRGTSGGARRHRIQRGLVGIQIAFAVMLVIAATLTIRSFGNLLRIDPGFDPSDVLTMRLSVPAADYPEPNDISGYYERLLDQVRQLPGVREAGAVRSLPLAQSIGDWSIEIEGREERPGQDFDGDWQIVTAGYFEAMRIPLQEGRFFESGDRFDGHQVVIVNEAMADLYWPGESALGKRFRMGGPDKPWLDIVGIVGNIRHNGISGTINSKWYRAHAQFARSVEFTPNGMSLVIRSEADPSALISPVRREVRALDRNVPVAAVQTMDEVLSGSVAGPRFTMTLLLVFGGVALSLAAIGVYGVISYSISERTHELGLRRALGATAGSVMGMVLRQGMTVAGMGVVVGVLGAFWLTSFMSSLLYEVGARDPVTFIGVPALLGLVALVATMLPATRAVGVEPSVALRESLPRP
jgi:predicted permease